MKCSVIKKFTATQRKQHKRIGNMLRLLFLHILSLGILLSPGISEINAAQCTIPPEAEQEDTSSPDTVIGNGTAASCTSETFVAAVAFGGTITFDCGPEPITITLTETAKVVNNTELPDIVIDGGNKITLSGDNARRILYMNTCDQNQVWTTSHCNDQDHPSLTVQNLTFIKGNAEGEDPDGGGAIFIRGGRFKALHCKFYNNKCDELGPDVGGGAIRVFDQSEDLPVYIVDSVFGGGEGLGNSCSNGGGLSSIGVSYTVINSLFSHNEVTGYGANPARTDTPGGGSGGAIYNDGNLFTLSLCGTAIHDNIAPEGGTAIFFVSNDRTGTLQIKNSALWNNPKGRFETAGYPGIFYMGNGSPQVTNSSIGEEAVPDALAVDVDGDGKIGLAEIMYALQAVAGVHSVEFTDYVRKKADINFDHETDLKDAMAGLKMLTDSP
jgi:hypothetical protein